MREGFIPHGLKDMIFVQVTEKAFLFTAIVSLIQLQDF